MKNSWGKNNYDTEVVKAKYSNTICTIQYLYNNKSTDCTDGYSKIYTGTVPVASFNSVYTCTRTCRESGCTVPTGTQYVRTD